MFMRKRSKCNHVETCIYFNTSCNITPPSLDTRILRSIIHRVILLHHLVQFSSLTQFHSSFGTLSQYTLGYVEISLNQFFITTTTYPICHPSIPNLVNASCKFMHEQSITPRLFDKVPNPTHPVNQVMQHFSL